MPRISCVDGRAHRCKPQLSSSHEDKDAYVGLLKSLKAAYLQHTNRELQPRFVLADASPVITSAIRDVFQGCQRAMCWAHVIRNID